MEPVEKIGKQFSCSAVDLFKQYTLWLESSKERYEDEYYRVLEDARNASISLVTTQTNRKAKQRDRYSDTFVFEDTRVKLLTAECDYINASFVGTNDSDRYIAAQAPLPHTIEDFWRMCADNQVPVILQLTNWLEFNGRKWKVKADVYLPESVGDELVYGEFKVRCSEVMENLTESGIVVRRLEVMSTKSKKLLLRSIFHIHYSSWPDYSTVSDISLYLKLHECTAKYINRSASENLRGNELQGPCVVHCSAGIGRSGTFIAVDLILRKLKAGDSLKEDDLDVAGVVKSLRTQRPLMVNTWQQYSMIYHAVYHYLFGECPNATLKRHKT